MSVLSPIIWARSMWRRLWLPSFTRSRLHGGSEKHRHPPYERGDRTLTAWYCLPCWQLSLESDTCQRRSRASSLMPLTSRYLRKINRTRSASSSTTTSLPFLSRGSGDRPPTRFFRRSHTAHRRTQGVGKRTTILPTCLPSYSTASPRPDRRCVRPSKICRSEIHRY